MKVRYEPDEDETKTKGNWAKAFFILGVLNQAHILLSFNFVA